MTIKADELKLAQTLSKFSEDYRTNYVLKRQTDDNFILHLKTDNFGELVRRLNHIKGCNFKIIELRGGKKMDAVNVDLIKTNVDALIGKSTVTNTDIDPVNGGVIKLASELWSCRPKHDKVIKANTRVKVIGVEGVSLIVEEVK